MTDLVLVNANVLTMDPSRPRACAVAVAGGRITALDEVPAAAEHVVDLRGATRARAHGVRRIVDYARVTAT